MGLRELDDAILLIEDHPDEVDFVGPRTEAVIRRAERVLGVEFPQTYREFLRILGHGRVRNREFFGIARDVEDTTGPMDAVRATLQARLNSDLPTGYVVISRLDGETFIAIDTSYRDEDEESPVVELPVGYAADEEPFATHDDFGTFFLDAVQDEFTRVARRPRVP